MLNALPFIGWFLSFVFNVSLAIPFWIVWTVCGVGQTYAYWLPKIYQAPSFWACVGIFMATGIIKAVFVPSLVSVRNDNDNGKN